MEYTIVAMWDTDSLVWIATSEDIPGLVLESGSLDALMERVRHAVPELLSLNGLEADGVFLSFRSEKREPVLQ